MNESQRSDISTATDASIKLIIFLLILTLIIAVQLLSTV